MNLWDAPFHPLRSKLNPASLDSTLVLLCFTLASTYTASTCRRAVAKLFVSDDCIHLDLHIQELRYLVDRAGISGATRAEFLDIRQVKRGFQGVKVADFQGPPAGVCQAGSRDRPWKTSHEQESCRRCVEPTARLRRPLEPLEMLPEECRPGRCVSCGACPLFVSPATSACG